MFHEQNLLILSWNNYTIIFPLLIDANRKVIKTFYIFLQQIIEIIDNFATSEERNKNNFKFIHI